MRGEWIKVRKSGIGPFDEDQKKPLYAIEDERAEDFAWVYLAKRRAWWAETKVEDATSRDLAFNIDQMVSMWLSRLAPVLDEKLVGLPNGPVRLRVMFKGDIQALAERVDVRENGVIYRHVNVPVDPDISSVAAKK